MGFLGSGQATAQPRRDREFSYFRESALAKWTKISRSKKLTEN